MQKLREAVAISTALKAKLALAMARRDAEKSEMMYQLEA